MVGSGLSSLDNSSMITALSNITHPLHLGMKAIVKIVAAYEDLSDSASQVASAIVNLFPGQYATVELMTFFANLSTAILKSLSGHDNRQAPMEDILTLDCQKIKSFFSGQPVTVVRQISLVAKAPDDDDDDDDDDGGGDDVGNNAVVLLSPCKKRRRSLTVSKDLGFGRINKEVIQVQYLHELTNRINQEVELLRICQSTSIEELEAMKKAPMLSQARHSKKLSQSFIKDFQEPIIRALNAKIVDLKENNDAMTCVASKSPSAGGSEVEAHGENSINAAEGETAISLTDWKNEAFSDLPMCPSKPVDKGYPKNMELKKLRVWAEEVYS